MVELTTARALSALSSPSALVPGSVAAHGVTFAPSIGSDAGRRRRVHGIIRCFRLRRQRRHAVDLVHYRGGGRGNDTE